MPISVRTDMGDIIIDFDASDPIEIIQHEIRDRLCVPLGHQRLVNASRQLDDGRRVLDYNIGEESTVFMMHRLLGGMQTSVEGITNDKEAEHSSTDGDSECSDKNQHNFWNRLLCVVGRYSIGLLVQQSLSDEFLGEGWAVLPLFA